MKFSVKSLLSVSTILFLSLIYSDAAYTLNTNNFFNTDSNIVLAKGSRSSSSSSRSSSRPSSKSSGSSFKVKRQASPPPAAAPAPAPATSAPKINTSRPSSSTANKSAVDSAINRNVNSKSNVYNTKASAVGSLKQKAPELEKKYPTKFTSEPASRPAYVPDTYRGQPVMYNQSYGGYGFTDMATGVFMGMALNEMLDDDKTQTIIMNGEGVKVDPAVSSPQVAPSLPANKTPKEEDGFPFITIIILFIGVGIGCFVIYKLVI